MKTPVTVGLGELAVSWDAEDILVAYGLGSCVALGMVDPLRKICGMVHCVLPERTEQADRLSPKYVDSGIEALLLAMGRAGADPRRLKIKMVGGANMLTIKINCGAGEIGARNILAAHRTLERFNLPLANEQVGGHCGRTVHLYVGDGHMTVREVGSKERDL